MRTTAPDPPESPLETKNIFPLEQETIRSLTRSLSTVCSRDPPEVPKSAQPPLPLHLALPEPNPIQPSPPLLSKSCGPRDPPGAHEPTEHQINKSTSSLRRSSTAIGNRDGAVVPTEHQINKSTSSLRRSSTAIGNRDGVVVLYEPPTATESSSLPETIDGPTSKNPLEDVDPGALVMFDHSKTTGQDVDPGALVKFDDSKTADVDPGALVRFDHSKTADVDPGALVKFDHSKTTGQDVDPGTLVRFDHSKTKDVDPGTLVRFDHSKTTGQEMVVRRPPKGDLSKDMRMGFEHCYVNVPCKERLSVLFATLRRSSERKVVVICSTWESSKFHAVLFRQLEMLRVYELAENMEDVAQAYDKFLYLYPGILFASDIAMREFEIPPNVDYVIQYEPPMNPTEYIYRMSNAKIYDTSCHKALLFLTPEEMHFLKCFDHIKNKELEARKVSGFQSSVEKLVMKHSDLNEFAWKAFRSFMLAYESHSHSDIYDSTKIDEIEVRRSFGQPHLPGYAKKYAPSKKGTTEKKKEDVDSGDKHQKPRMRKEKSKSWAARHSDRKKSDRKERDRKEKDRKERDGKEGDIESDDQSPKLHPWMEKEKSWRRKESVPWMTREGKSWKNAHTHH